MRINNTSPYVCTYSLNNNMLKELHERYYSVLCILSMNTILFNLWILMSALHIAMLIRKMEVLRNLIAFHMFPSRIKEANLLSYDNVI